MEQNMNLRSESPLSILRNETGSGTLLSASLVSLLIITILLMGVAFSAETVKMKSQNAADLAAIAAVEAIRNGDDGCKIAQSVAENNSAELTTCALKDQTAEIHTQKTIISYFGSLGTVKTHAKASIHPDCN
jgi:secretion/DNA translocation related TadE-like protein